MAANELAQANYIENTEKAVGENEGVGEGPKTLRQSYPQGFFFHDCLTFQSC